MLGIIESFPSSVSYAQKRISLVARFFYEKAIYTGKNVVTMLINPKRYIKENDLGKYPKLRKAYFDYYKK